VRGLKEGLKCDVIQQVFKCSKYFNDFVIVNHDNPSSSSKLYVTIWEWKGKEGFKYKVPTKH